MRALAVLAALFALALTTSCGGAEGDGAMPAPATTTAEDPEQGGPIEARERAPEVAGLDLSGEAISLGDFRGRPVLVNVWSSW